MKMRLERSAERDKREIINNLSLNHAQSNAEGILNRFTSHKRSTPIMMLDRMEGNAELKTSVQQMLATRRLTHSVLLVGEAGLGTGFAARCIAADYLYPAGGAAAEALLRGECCRAVAKAGKRDSGTVETGIVREAISVSGMGSGGKYLVGQVTAMRSEIFNTSLSAEGRAVLLYHVERMNEESANALLKVMEEPPEGVLFLLTADSLASVLPTIRSRCVSFAVAPVSPADCTRYCAAQGVDKKTAALYSELFDGHIGTVLAVARDEARAAQVEKALELARAAAARDSYTGAGHTGAAGGTSGRRRIAAAGRTGEPQGGALGVRGKAAHPLKITKQQETPPALAVHRRGFLFGVLLWCEEESCAGKRLRPHCPCKIQYTRFYEKSHYISVKNQKSS